jgi:exopolysaccharide biosynthesis polyprenyl glycosylphosphotransferase
MWKRYLVGNPEFVLRAMREVVAEKRSRRAPERIAKGRFRSAYRRMRWALQGHITPFLKRSLDVVVAGSALLAASPVFILTALAIRLNSPGPIFFSQQRVGYRGREFRFWKFRSMYTDAEARKAELQVMNEMDGGVLFKMKNDPRITPVGRFIRRFSIDELPQLWNVLRGDMALVGPRPALPAEVEQYSIAQRQRLMARPGITCIWQISGRSNIPFDQQVEMDKEYIHKSTLKTDIKLLIKTVPAVLSGDGAY